MASRLFYDDGLAKHGSLAATVDKMAVERVVSCCSAALLLLCWWVAAALTRADDRVCGSLFGGYSSRLDSKKTMDE